MTSCTLIKRVQLALSGILLFRALNKIRYSSSLCMMIKILDTSLLTSKKILIRLKITTKNQTRKIANGEKRRVCVTWNGRCASTNKLELSLCKVCS